MNAACRHCSRPATVHKLVKALSGIRSYERDVQRILDDAAAHGRSRELLIAEAERVLAGERR